MSDQYMHYIQNTTCLISLDSGHVVKNGFDQPFDQNCVFLLHYNVILISVTALINQETDDCNQLQPLSGNLCKISEPNNLQTNETK